MKVLIVITMLIAGCGSKHGQPCKSDPDCAAGLVCRSVCETPAEAVKHAEEATAREWMAGEEARLTKRIAELEPELVKVESLLDSASDPTLKSVYAKSKEDVSDRLRDARHAIQNLAAAASPVSPKVLAERMQAKYLKLGKDTIVCHGGMVEARGYVGCRYGDADPPTMLWAIEGTFLKAVNGKAIQDVDDLREVWIGEGRRPEDPDIDIQKGTAATRH